MAPGSVWAHPGEISATERPVAASKVLYVKAVIPVFYFIVRKESHNVAVHDRRNPRRWSSFSWAPPVPARQPSDADCPKNCDGYFSMATRFIR
jgi:hypothetical protein